MNREPMSHDDVIDLASGYVLGALEPAEEAAVRDHLATCSLAHPELEELGGVIAALLEDVELVEPPAALRDRIMDAARADLASRESRGPGSVAEQPPALPAAFPTAAEREVRRAARTSRLDWALRIAAVIAVVAVGA